jgi:hypothetical protein
MIIGVSCRRTSARVCRLDSIPVLSGSLLSNNGSVSGLLYDSEAEFRGLADGTGGGLWLPGCGGEMVEQAREVDCQYVVNYRPRRSLAEAEAAEYRRLDVFGRRLGLRVRSRRGCVAGLR